MKIAFLLMLPMDTIHSHSQVVALKIYVKKHLDQWKTFSNSLEVYCYAISSPCLEKEQLRYSHMNYLYFFSSEFCLLFDSMG